MENDERTPIRKTPGLENSYDFSNSRRSSTSLSLVGISDTPTDLREINVYDRMTDSPISPPVHARCRSTTEYTTTEKSYLTTTPTPKFQCTRSQCPSRSTTRSADCKPCFRSPGPRSPPSCVPCAKAATKSPCASQCSTQSPCGPQCAATQQSPCTATQGTTQSPCTATSTESPCTQTSTTRKCTERTAVATCPTRPATTCTPSSPTTCSTSTSPTCTNNARSSPCTVPLVPMRTSRTSRASSTTRCTGGSPDCTARSTTPFETTTEGTPRTTTTDCTSPTGCSPGTQSVDSRGAQCPLDSCRDTRRKSFCCQEEQPQQQKMCPLDLCKMRAGLIPGTGAPSTTTGSSASRSICSSPTSNNNAASTKRVPFPSKKTDDDSAGGVVRWTEKCSQRCKRPTWNSNRWNCDKPATRPCIDCPGAHPAISRCAQDYDAHRFGAVDGRAMRKCDCCDKRSYPPMMTNQMPASYQTLDRGPPVSNCGCDAYARGINHYRKPPPPVMPQNPFDNSSSAYFNRLHKGMPFANQQPPPPPPPPSFNPMPQPPFNPPFNHPPPNVSTVTTRDNSLNVLQDSDNFTSPMKNCTSCDPNGMPDSPNQNINMVTNPHMFNNAVYMPHNSSAPNMPHGHNYLP